MVVTSLLSSFLSKKSSSVVNITTTTTTITNTNLLIVNCRYDIKIRGKNFITSTISSRRCISSTGTGASNKRSWRNSSCSSQHSFPLQQQQRLTLLFGGGRGRPQHQHQHLHLFSRRMSSSSSSVLASAAVQAVNDTTTTTTTSAAAAATLTETTISKIIKSLPPRLLQDDDLNTFDTTTTFQRNNVMYEYESGKPVIIMIVQNDTSNNKNMTSQDIVNWKFHDDDDDDCNSNSNDDGVDEKKSRRLVSIEWDNGVTTKHDLLTLKRYYDQRQGGGGRVVAAAMINEEVDDETEEQEKGEENGESQTKDIISNNAENVRRLLWTDLTEDDVRQSPEMSMTYERLISGYGDGDGVVTGMKQALKSLYQYGIVLITNTPTDDPSAIAALGAAVGGGSVKASPDNSMLVHYLKNVRGRDNDGNNGVDNKSITVLPDATDGALRTLYGSVWSTSSGGQADGTSVADSAYGNGGLPLHTDMTYLRDPPGLQIFTMVQPALKGGESVFGDGFAVAEELRRSNPDAFHTLSTTTRRYHSRDEVTGWHLQASGPIIDIRHDTDGRIESIRHNDLDRLPDIPPSHLTAPEEINDFYDKLDVAHKAWDTLLQQDKFRLVMKLRPGDTMVVANQRCFHGRCSFESSNSTPRSVIGCYVSQDELLSRMRMEGYDV